jgi:hypothetical protein
MTAPASSIKLSIPLSRVDYYLHFAAPDTRGRAMQTHLTYHRHAKARVADDPHRILENSDLTQLKSKRNALRRGK